MAKVKFAGATISALPIEQLPSGDWLMEAQEHGPRFAHGTKIRVKKSEIVSMAAAEMPAVDTRRNLVVGKLPADVVAAIKAAQMQPPPDLVPVLTQTTQDHDDMSKLSQLAAVAADTHKEIEAGADASLNRLTKARGKAKEGLAKLDKLSDAVEKGISDIEDMANQISNGGPPLA